MHVAIIGNGITGATCALRLRELQPDWRITIISGESDYPFSRPALMYLFMGHMQYKDCKPWQDEVWEKHSIDRLRDWVTGIDAEAQTLQLHRSGTLRFDKLLLATGSKPNYFGWPGQDLAGVQGFYSLMDLRQLHDNCEAAKQAVIVGGGLIGLELGEMLHSRGIAVSFLVREASYWNVVLPSDESLLVNRAIVESGMQLLLEQSLDHIEDDGAGRVCAIHTAAGERIEAQIVGLTAGVHPNLELVAETEIECGRGILVDASFRTSADNIYAAGDCAEIRTAGDGRNILEQVWYTGKAQALVAAESMAGKAVTYEAGIWFNSAKFLDLEYQTYGQVNRKVPGESSLYWESTDGKHALRLVHLDGKLIGVNAIGMRMRHRVCERWIGAGIELRSVVQQLHEADFEPEFGLQQRHARDAALLEQLEEVTA